MTDVYDTFYRLDLVFDGALETTEYYNAEEIWPAWNFALRELEQDYPDNDWELCIYDERGESDLIKNHANKKEDNNE